MDGPETKLIETPCRDMVNKELTATRDRVERRHRGIFRDYCTERVLLEF
jgi:hypothetical protein